MTGEAEMAEISESVTARPAQPLAPFLAGYTGYRQEDVAPGTHRGLPSPYLTVIFTIGEPLVIASHPDPRQPPGSYEALAGGLHTAPALITHDGSQSGVQAYLSPLGARALLGIPAGQLAGLDLPAADLLGPLAAELGDRLRDAASWPERFAAVDDALLRRLGTARHADRRSAELTWAWQRLITSGGQVPVTELAAGTGWSDRHLRARFSAEIGLAPKPAGRVIRFHRARRLLQQRARSGRCLDLAGLAAHCGYYDQAHLDREFRQLAGSSPTGWLASEFRFVQAGAAEPVAG